MPSHVWHCRKLKLDHTENGEPPKVFEQETDLVRFAVYKDHFGGGIEEMLKRRGWMLGDEQLCNYHR